jgi:CRISPR-associated protein Cst2
MLVDAPASALNNAKDAEDAKYDNEVGVKMIRVRGEGLFPYVSAQSFRYWLRSSLAKNSKWEAHTAPVFRENKIAYTDSNPLLYWDDDLLGYMRAESNKVSAKAAREEDANRANATETQTSITRTSPLRTSTLVSIAPAPVVKDFGTMTRHEGDPVPHSHQFYRTVFKGLFSLDLNSAGTFSYRNKSGNRNLDEVRQQQAKTMNLEHLEGEKAYRLPLEERSERVATLISALGQLEGGAKQSIHYTDVTPVVVLAMVFQGGNNPLNYLIGADRDTGRPRLNEAALAEMLEVWGDHIQGKIYVGWTQGFHDSERGKLEDALKDLHTAGKVVFGHPKKVLEQLAADLRDPANAPWFD